MKLPWYMKEKDEIFSFNKWWTLWQIVKAAKEVLLYKR